MTSSIDDLADTPCDEIREARLELKDVCDDEDVKIAVSAGDLIAGNSSHRPTSFGSSRPVLKPAFSEPLHVLGSPFTPPTPEDIGLGFYTHEGLSRSFYQQPPIGGTRRYSWHCQTPLPPHPQLQFFSIRAGALSRAILQCRSLADEVLDGDMRGVWLLTQINHWDLELERLVMLCDCSLLIFKYDFIALKPLHFTRLDLRKLSKAVLGEIVYPQRSLVPIISGLAGGVVSILRGVLFPRLHSTLRTIASKATVPFVSNKKDGSDEEKPQEEVNTKEETAKKVAFDSKLDDRKCYPDSGTSSLSSSMRDTDSTATANPEQNKGLHSECKEKSSAFGSLLPNVSFDSRSRDLPGLRLFTKDTKVHHPDASRPAVTHAPQNTTSCSEENSEDLTNSGTALNKPGCDEKKSNVSWQQKWNPFCATMPYHTLTSHPLYWYTSGSDASTYDVVALAKELGLVLTELASQPDTAEVCSLRVSKVFQPLFCIPKRTSSAPSDSSTSQGTTRHGSLDASSEEEKRTGGSPYSKIKTKEDEELDEQEDKLVVENYVGLVSLLHNAAHLGYFKMRGKISF